MTDSDEKKFTSLEHADWRRRQQTTRMALVPMKGLTHNPLRKLPRNMPCPCRSLKKFKNCCLDKLPLVVAVADAEKYAEMMAKPDLVFETPANKDRLSEEAAKLATDPKPDPEKH